MQSRFRWRNAMDKFFVFLIILFVLVFTSCKVEEKSSSILFQNFNLEELIKKISTTELKSLGGSGSNSTSNGKEGEYRRSFNLDYRIEEQNDKKFNESRFLGELKSEVAKKLGEAEMYINGVGAGDGSFYFNYSKGSNKGWIEVVGVRLEVDKYRLWCVVRESVDFVEKN